MVAATLLRCVAARRCAMSILRQQRNSTSVSAFSATTPSPVVCFYADWAEVPLPAGHRFPMNKYRDVRKLLEDDASLVGRLELRRSPEVALADVLRVHCSVYVQRVLDGTLSADEQRVVGFPWSAAHVTRSLASTGGTAEAVRLCLRDGHRAALQVAGGTHHAFYDRGEAFCVWNDLAVGARIALHEYGLTSVLIVDLDVHQGNGTAALFADEPRVVTFSMHGEKNYPWKSRTVSTYDVELPDATGDDEYLRLLNEWLPVLFERHKPELVLFQAGVDVLVGDALGRLALTRAGVAKRNHAVFSACVAARVPCVVVMGGGYCRPIGPTVDAHADVFRAAAMRFSMA